MKKVTMRRKRSRFADDIRRTLRGKWVKECQSYTTMAWFKR